MILTILIGILAYYYVIFLIHLRWLAAFLRFLCFFWQTSFWYTGLWHPRKAEIKSSIFRKTKQKIPNWYHKLNSLLFRAQYTLRRSESFKDSLWILPQSYFLVKLNFRNILLSNLCHKMAPSLAILALKYCHLGRQYLLYLSSRGAAAGRMSIFTLQNQTCRHRRR